MRNSSATLTYPDDSAGNTVGAAHTFDEGLSDGLYYAKSGAGSFSLVADMLGYKDFYYTMKYGHSTILASVSFSVSAPGGGAGTITFSLGVTTLSSLNGSKIWE